MKVVIIADTLSVNFAINNLPNCYVRDFVLNVQFTLRLALNTENQYLTYSKGFCSVLVKQPLSVLLFEKLMK